VGAARVFHPALRHLHAAAAGAILFADQFEGSGDLGLVEPGKIDLRQGRGGRPVLAEKQHCPHDAKSRYFLPADDHVSPPLALSIISPAGPATADPLGSTPAAARAIRSESCFGVRRTLTSLPIRVGRPIYAAGAAGERAMSYPTPVPNAAVTFAPYREMTRAVRPIRARECAICLGPHEE